MARWLTASTLSAGMAVLAIALAVAPEAQATERQELAVKTHHIRHHHKRVTHPAAAPLDHSGKAQHGLASYYAPHFDGRKMANGKRFNPDVAVAASKTLPLGTTAKVTNLQNGRSAIVRIEDRGPYIRGRVVDLAPSVARRLGMKRKGVVPVVVLPLSVPQPDGTVKSIQHNQEVADLNP